MSYGDLATHRATDGGAPWGSPMARTLSASSFPATEVIGADGSLTGYGGGTQPQTVAAQP